MTHIKSVETSGFRKAVSVSLQPLTIITGRRGSGKTSVIDAIRACFLGYIPGYPKTNPGMAKAMYGEHAVCRIKGDGVESSFSLTQNGSSVSKNWKKPKANCPALMMDDSKFLELSDSEKVSLIQSLTGIRGGDVRDALKSLISGVTNDREIISKEKELGDWITETEKAIKAKANSLRQEIATYTSGVVSVVGEIEEIREFDQATYDAICKRIRAAILKLDQVKASHDRRGRDGARIGYVVNPKQGDSTGALQVQLNDLKKRYDVAARKKDDLEREMFASEKRAEKKIPSCCPTCGAGKKHWSNESMKVQEKTVDHTQEIETLMGDEASIEGLMEDVKGKLNWIEKEEIESEVKSMAEQIAKLDEEITSMTRERDAMEDDRQAYAKYAAEKDVKSRLEKKIEGLQKDHELYKGLLGSFQAETKRLSANIMRPLVQNMNVIGRNLGMRWDHDGFSIVACVGDYYVPMVSLSGSEKIMTVAALQVALAIQQEYRCVIVDEAARMDRSDFANFASAMHDAINQGILDQVIICLPEVPEGVILPGSWEIVKM